MERTHEEIATAIVAEDMRRKALAHTDGKHERITFDEVDGPYPFTVEGCPHCANRCLEPAEHYRFVLSFT